jgi:hypothetical protein
MAKQVVLERLNQLVAKGYIVRWGGSEQDTLRLEHPRAPDLTLFSDGRIWILTPQVSDRHQYLTGILSKDRGARQELMPCHAVLFCLTKAA